MTGPEPVPCAEHPGTLTNLRCGKCGKPICPKCLVQTPVGARCRECARIRKTPTYNVSGSHYLKASLTAFFLAIVIGGVWGLISSYLPTYIFSLIVAMGIGWVIGELTSRVVNRKRSPLLAVIGGIGVTLCYAVVFLVDSLMTGDFVLYLSRVVWTLVSLGVGIYFAVSRLR